MQPMSNEHKKIFFNSQKQNRTHFNAEQDDSKVLVVSRSDISRHRTEKNTVNRHHRSPPCNYIFTGDIIGGIFIDTFPERTRLLHN